MDLVTPYHIFFSGSPGPDFGLPEPPSLWGTKQTKKKTNKKTNKKQNKKSPSNTVGAATSGYCERRSSS
jgi:hypothetical protein